MRKRGRFFHFPGKGGVLELGAMEDRIERLESIVSLQERTIEQLDDVVTDQQRQIDELERKLMLLGQRLRDMQTDDDPEGPEPPPPHYGGGR